jgi:hypothetical protein
LVRLRDATIPLALSGPLGPLVAPLQGIGIGFDQTSGSAFALGWLWIAGLLCIVFFGPNTAELLRRFRPALDYVPRNVQLAPRETHGMLAWIPSRRWAAVFAFMFTVSVLSMSRVSEFLYYQF